MPPNTQLTPIQQFCTLVRSRSAEHVAAAQLLFNAGHYGQVVAVLRQELDSQVHTVFLLHQDHDARQHYLRQTLRHEPWTVPNTRTKITDRAMVEFTNRLHG